jgi:hypothetical protein
MKTPKKTISKDPVSKPITSKKESEEDDDIQELEILNEDEDDFDVPLDVPLDDLDAFNDFDDDDDDTY